MHHVLASPPPAIAAPALATHEPEEPPPKDVGEDVIHAAAPTATFPQTLFPIAVVQLLLLWVHQNFVGKADLLKLPQGAGRYHSNRGAYQAVLDKTAKILNEYHRKLIC